MELKDFQKRVVSEQYDLDEKINSLQEFIETSEQFSDLSLYERRDLAQQLRFMKKYSNTLSNRINRFNFE